MITSVLQCMGVATSGDTNLSLRRNIVDRILKLYQLTCKNLTVVNDNLSRAQGIVEVRWEEKGNGYDVICVVMMSSVWF